MDIQTRSTVQPGDIIKSLALSEGMPFAFAVNFISTTHLLLANCATEMEQSCNIAYSDGYTHMHPHFNAASKSLCSMLARTLGLSDDDMKSAYMHALQVCEAAGLHFPKDNGE